MLARTCLLAVTLLPCCLADQMAHPANESRTVGVGRLTRFDEQTTATPQRPSLSSSTATTAAGTVELEAGVDLDPDDSLAFPVMLKYGLNDHAEVFVGGVPWQAVQVAGGPDARGSGDVLLGARSRFWSQQQTDLAAAWLLALQLPTGSRSAGLSEGESSVFGAAILDGSRGPVDWTAYYEYGSLGDPSGAGRDSRHTLAFSLARQLDEVFGSYGELAWLRSRGRDENPLFVFVGLTASSDPATVWDLGARLGLNRDAGQAVLTAGVTINFGRVGQALPQRTATHAEQHAP